MIHIYYGDGKGKSTAACGLAVRAAGSGMRVLFVQFLKAGTSAEMEVLHTLNNLDFLVPPRHFGWYKTLSEEQRAALKADYGAMLSEVLARAAQCELIVLDEALWAYKFEMLDRQALLDFLKAQGQQREIVLTGREAPPELLALTDYATNMHKVHHPFDKGIGARKGIEY
ncbi:MAG: cob(I)yrinic acid a,c-diamide adenosyltransferase [Clostridia bacterium]|nr:cob(I)yrinic acid a,c-diamide adenosyltransferase [Clostridia bacterium]